MEGPDFTRPPVAERVSSALREEILRGRYVPGDVLPPERELSARLGVNRGAVREGLRALSQLGLVEVGPRGARVTSLDDASLDVLGHLLELDEIPDATLVNQVLEVHGALFSTCVRMAVERGDQADLDRAIALLRRIHEQGIADEEIDEESLGEAIHEFVSVLVDASGNFVLRLVRNGLRPQYWKELESLVRIRPPRERVRPLAESLIRALEKRDPKSASEGTYALMRVHREFAVDALRGGEAHAMRSAIQERLTARSAGSTAPRTERS